ncbi:MAG: 4-hydroxyphenylacetate decarboxylase small subunit [Negativicutes bacterium]|nr:4-hydroxyphenylacetate decarboxylase small subunit [Negativicutes bacterium]
MTAVHGDCRYFLATDVAKGQCLRNQIPVGWDEPACPDGQPAAKCKFCGNFSHDRCTAVDGGFWAYADMRADNCPDYRPEDPAG